MNKMSVFVGGVLCAAALMGSVSAFAQATRYTVATGNYGTVVPHTSCPVGPCQDYTTSQSISGWFQTAAPLAASMAMQPVSAQVTAFSFSDGINTYTNTDPNVREISIGAETDGTGKLTDVLVMLNRWQTGSAPHSTSDFTSTISVGSVTASTAYHYVQCSTVATSGPSGVADTCYAVATPGARASTAEFRGALTLSQAAVPAPAPVTASVPTLSEWGALTMAALLAWFGGLVLRRRRSM